MEEECASPTTIEHDRFRRRSDLLRLLERRLQRGNAVGAAVKQLLRLEPAYVDTEWPSSCAPCGEVRSIVDDVLVALRDGELAMGPITERMGSQLRWAEGSDVLLSTVCVARMRAFKQATALRERFAYFAWTRTGVNVLAFVDALHGTTGDAIC